MQQQKFRELLLQSLFALTEGDVSEQDLVTLLVEVAKTSHAATEEAVSRARILLEKQDEINALFARMATDWPLERIRKTERCILQIGTYEILYEEEIPPKVSIAEAIRLAKKFGSSGSDRFVCAILNGVMRSHDETHAAAAGT